MRIPFKRIDRNKKNIYKKKHSKNKEKEAEGKRDSQKWMKNNNYQFFFKENNSNLPNHLGRKIAPHA